MPKQPPRSSFKEMSAGQKYARLTVIKEVESGSRGRMFLFRCECGNKVTKFMTDVRRTGSKVQSCGCLHKEVARKQGKANAIPGCPSRHPLIATYRNMISRCHDKKSKVYQSYGGRGIRVCKKWRKGHNDKTGFEVFCADMGERPNGMSLDRKNNDSGYSKENCRWATSAQQNSNKRSNVLITAFGKKKVLAHWSHKTGIGEDLIKWRISKGWEPELALSTSPNKNTGVVPVTVESIRKAPKQNKYVYDIEVSKNHNFFADGVLVHNCHQSAAHSFSTFVYKIDAPYRLGLSATPRRKDKRDAITDFTIGPVTAVAETVTLKPTIEAVTARTEPAASYRTWSGALGWISDNKERNIEIVRRVFSDLRNGNTSIIIPVMYRRHQDLLVKLINNQAKVNRVKRKEEWPNELAVGFYSGCNRKRVLARADDTSQPCVMVAIFSMIKQGVDLKAPSMLHVVIPMSATAEVGAPAFRQLSFRVATPTPGKTNPKVCVWVDPSIKMFMGCMKGLLFQEIIPGVKRGEYILGEGTYDVMSGKSYSIERKSTSSVGGSWA